MLPDNRLQILFVNSFFLDAQFRKNEYFYQIMAPVDNCIG
jgi:hypothetical protein